MAQISECSLKRMLLGGIMLGMIACATAGSADFVRHGFGLEVDQSLSEVRNIRYHYGDLKELKEYQSHLLQEYLLA